MKTRVKGPLSSICLLGVLSAIGMGFGHYTRYGGGIVPAIGMFLATLAWLAFAGSVAMIAVWAVRTARY